MKRFFFLWAVLLFGTAICACTAETDIGLVDESRPAKLIFEVSPFNAVDENDVTTKTHVTPVNNYSSYRFSWSVNDTVGIFPSGGSQIYFLVDSDGEASSASFDGGAWMPKEGYSFYAYFPFIGDYYLNATQVPVSFTGQKQIGNNNSDHFQQYDYMYTPVTTYDQGSNAFRFSFKHLITCVLPWVELPAGHYTGLDLSIDEPLFVTKGNYNLTADNPAITGKEYSNAFHVDLDISFTQTETLIAYVPLAPLNISGKTLTITITDEAGKQYTYTYKPSKAYAASNVYRLRSSVSFAIGSVSVNPTELNLYVDETQQLTATVLPENAANKNVTWTSSNPSVATVSETGLITALTPGTTTITVTTVEGGESATCAVTVSEASDLATPLCLQAIEAGTVTVSNPKGLTIEYKKNASDWVSASDATIDVSVAVGDRVYFRGNNASYGTSDDEYTNISCTGNAYVYGNVMSLINSQSFETLTSLTGERAFACLFRNNGKIQNHPSREILLPATTLSNQCYRLLFDGCTGLTSAPELPAMTIPFAGYKFMFRGCLGLTTPPSLPATTVSSNSYFGMFQECTELQTPPELPATQLGTECYYQMFYGCSKLQAAPALPATTLAERCYAGMFSRCVSLTEAPVLPAETMASACYKQMFLGCSNLQSAPALPATNLAKDCYYAIFANCTSLTTAPELPVTTLAVSCYAGMFNGCTKLETAPALPATTLAAECYKSMFYNCKKLASSPDLLAETLVEGCYQTMFYGCNMLNRIKMLAIDISAENALASWTTNVASTGTFYKNYDAAWDVTGVNGVPTGWTVDLVMTRDPILVSSITLNSTSLTLSIGDTQTLTATIAPDNADDKSVTWSSSDATVASVDQTGKVTALKEGTATITVTAQDGSGKTGTCAVTVNAIPVTGVTLNQTSLSFTVMNQTQQLHATVLPDNATYKTVTWTSNNESVAIVSSTGVVTAKGDGTVTITATAGGKSATCTVSVTLTVPVTGVTLNKTTLTLTPNATETLTATVAPSNATNQNVTWSSDNTSVATVSNGTVTAVAVGTANITVTTADGNKQARCAVTVNPIRVTSVTLNKTSYAFTSLNATLQLSATVKPDDATYKTVSWTSDDTSVATVDQSGKVTSKGSGTTTIRATADGKSATCAITVSIPVTGVSLNMTTLTLSPNETYLLQANVTPTSATNKGVTWSSNNTTVATVLSSGLVTAKAEGTAKITVTTIDGNKTAECTVTVFVPVTSITLNYTSLTLELGKSKTLVATVLPENATDKTVTWTVANSSVVTINDNGVVQAVGCGTVTVVARAGNESAMCQVTVINPVGAGGEGIIWE